MRVILLVGLAAIGLLPGCREAPISFAAVPGPALSDDLALAERRGGRELTPEEFDAFIDAHDRYLAAWLDTIRLEAEPLVRDVRAVRPEDLRKDSDRIRRLVARQKSVLAGFADLDRDLAASIATLAPDTVPIAEAFAARRSLERMNAVLVSDGGSVVADLRDSVEEAFDDPDLPPLESGPRAGIVAILARHDRESVPLRERVAKAAVELTRDWRQIEDASPPAEELVDPVLAEEDRENARNRIAFERIAAARGRLETALTRLADRDDATVAEIEAIAPAFGDSLRARLLRLRTRAAWGGSEIRRLSFLGLVASKAIGLDAATRERVVRLRADFLAADRERLGRLLAVIREGLVPGVFEPGGPGSGGRRFERIQAIDQERQQAAREFRGELERLLPGELIASLDGLPVVAADELPDAIASIVGAGRISPVLRAMPADFRREGGREQRQTGVEDDAIGRAGGTGKREAAIFLPPPLGPGELDRFADRCGVEDEVRATWRALAIAHAERRAELESDEIRRFEAVLERAVRSVTSPVSGDETSRAIAAVFSLADSIRVDRLAAFESLVDDLVAAAPVAPPAVEVAFWKLERTALAREIRWSVIPGFDELAVSREARVDPARLVGTLGLPREARARCLALADERGAEVAGEDLRRACGDAVRRMFTFAIAAQVEGRRLDENSEEFLGEFARIRSAAAAAGRRLSEINRAIIDELAAGLPREEGRRLREAFVDAAFPGLLDLDNPLANALDRVRFDPGLGERIFPMVLVLLEARDEARDRAIDGLRAWKDSEGGERVDGDTRGEDLGRTEPRLGYHLVMRREADLRAVRRIRDLLDDAALARHPRIAEDQRPPRPPISSIRSYD